MVTEVAVVTGTRAEYGILRSVMERIEVSTELSLSTIVTGMHLSPAYGHTIDDIRDDGFEVTRTVEMLLDSDSDIGMAKSLGIGLSGMAETLASVDPSVVLVLGDRGEAFAAGVAASHLDIPVAHIHGGDETGGAVVDDSIRHSLTKFAHVHFPGSKLSAKRIEQLGEESWRINPVGALALNDIDNDNLADTRTIQREYDVDATRETLLVVQHPLTVDTGDPYSQMTATLGATTEFNATKVVIYPNSDSGGSEIIKAIQEFEDRSDVQTYRSLPREDYLGVLAAADVIVGNSSSGIVEAPSLETPTVDVGPRQQKREHADSVVSVPHDRRAISDAIGRCLSSADIGNRAKPVNNPYDLGDATATIIDNLERIDFEDESILKKEFVR